MRFTTHAVLLALLVAGQGCNDNNLTSKAADPDGPPVGRIYVVVNEEEFASGGHSDYTTGHSDRWIGGKQTNTNPFSESYARGWWFDLVHPDGTYEGCAAIGWDPESGRTKFLCRSWLNIDLSLTKPDGEVVAFEHRPRDLSPLSVSTNQVEPASDGNAEKPPGEEREP